MLQGLCITCDKEPDMILPISGLKRSLTRSLRGMTASVAFAVTLMLTPATVQAENLSDALADAYRNSGLLEQNRALLRFADDEVAVQFAALRPIVNWATDFTRQYGTSRSNQTFGVIRGSAANELTVGLSMELLLWDAGRTELGVERAKESVLATREALRGVEQRVLLAAVQAYMSVRATSETVGLRENNLRVISEELRAANDRFEVGEVTRTDVALTEARLAAARAGLAQAQGDRAIAIEDFRAAVGRRPGSLTAPERRAMPAASPDAAKQVALRGHPDMRQAGHEITAAELALAAARKSGLPTVNLTGSLGATDQFGSSNFSRGGTIGVEASGPIYQGGRINALQRQAVGRVDAARGNLHATREQIAQGTGSAWAQVEVARAARAATEEQIRAAQVAFQGVREEATLGARTTLDVLNAEQELLDARANQITAASNEITAYYALLASMGLLTAEQLKLRVQIYDPAEYYNLVKSAPLARSAQGQQLDRVLKSLSKQ